jgi:hypothetical protein
LVERQEEHEYERRGTRRSIANLEAATGQGDRSLDRCKTRTDEDFACHIARSVAADPEAGWIFVVDRLNTHHQSEDSAKLVAEEGPIESESDGKGNLKHIEAMASRRTFLREPSRRIRFAYTPRSTPRGSIGWSRGFPSWCASLL